MEVESVGPLFPGEGNEADPKVWIAQHHVYHCDCESTFHSGKHYTMHFESNKFDRSSHVFDSILVISQVSIYIHTPLQKMKASSGYT